MPKAGKLARFRKDNRRLRSENKDLAESVYELEGSHNPSMLRRYVGVTIGDASSYGLIRMYVYMQQKGWMPKMVPVDLIAGVLTQGVTSMYEGPISSVFFDIGDGLAKGSLGRLATLHQLEETETAGGVCYLAPGVGVSNGATQ